MNRIIAPIVILVALLVTSCDKKPQKTLAPLASQSDSLAYVIGQSVAENLIAMDSTINLAVVGRAILESGTKKALLKREDGKNYYLRYITYVEPERKRGYEEQWLEDLSKSDRKFTRSKSGLTYNVEVIGDESLTPRSVNDLVSLCYTITRIDGEQIYSSQVAADTTVVALRDLRAGVQESLKMIGKGGKIEAWIPSALGYGEYGDSLLRIAPFETLHYQIELIDMDRNGALGKR